MNKKWWLAGLMSLGIAINYLDRVNISHAIIPISKELSLTPFQQGLIMSAFSWGYVIFMFLGGILVDKIGSFKSALFAATAWSLATACSGVSSSWKLLLSSRIAVGMGEAPIFPANAKLVKENFEIHERGRATAIFDSGSYFGTALSAPIIVFIMVKFGWRWAFFVSAIIGILWVILWHFAAPRLSREPIKQSKIQRVEWNAVVFKLLKNRKILGASLGFFCYNYSKNFYLTWFPSYLVNERGFSLLKVGIFAMLPAFCAILGELVAGWGTDKLVYKGKSVTLARKLPIILGLVLSSTIALSSFVTSQWAIIALLSFSFAATIAASPGIWAIPGDIAPNADYVGTIGGIQNTISNIAGIVAPIITGLIIQKFSSYGVALAFTGIITVIGALSYWLIVGKLTPIEVVEGKAEVNG